MNTPPLSAPVHALSEEHDVDFRVTVGGRRIPVCGARVSAVPFNRVWPGHQRSIDQTEIASFASFDADFTQPVSITVEVISKQIDRVEIRPTEYGVVPEIDHAARTLTFTLDRPRHLSVEVNGRHHALHLFANPLAAYEVDTESPDTLYFGPGIHTAGLILPKANQTVYLAEGAIVYGAILVHRADNVRILGRGILDASPYDRGMSATPGEPGGELIERGLAAGLPRENVNYVGNLAAIGCNNLVIDGIILRDSSLWSVNIRNGCRHVTIRNVKIIGQWRYNADGINICTSSHTSVSGCFIRAFDDCVIARGTHMLDERDPLECLVVSDCVLWCDWGRALEIWTGFKNARISQVTFRDIHIIRTCHIAMDIQAWWGAPDSSVTDVLMENISMESDPVPMQPAHQLNEEHTYAADPQGGHAPKLFCAVLNDPGEKWLKYFPHDGGPRHVNYRNITVRDIRFYGEKMPQSIIGSDDASLQIEGIRLIDIRGNGKKVLTPEAMQLTANGIVRNLTIT